MRNTLFFLLIFLSACSILPYIDFDELYGEENTHRYDIPVAGIKNSPIEFHKDIQPILNNRCTVCHGCYDAPCQLNLASYEGLSRGANKELVYNGTRIFSSTPTRLFTDAETNTQWRNKGFYPVLNERNPSGDINASVIARMLALKKAEKIAINNQPLPQEKFDFSLDRSQFCPTIDQMETYEKSQPHGGMPYGLPALTDSEHQTLTQWIKNGAPISSAQALSQNHQRLLSQWEVFLNGDSYKNQLMARYIYEHWFLANLYFDDISDGNNRQFFKVIRSSTPPGSPIKVIPTRRPFDDPNVSRVYYRLKPVFDTILFKTHMPYALNPKRMKNLTNWFLNDSYTVKKLPGYEPIQTANPFITFAQLPANSRYKFMLDEARFTIMGFIKGAVCRGQIALNVINDHFWVVFANPEENNSPYEESSKRESFIETTYNLRLPADSGSTAGISNWLQYSHHQMEYLEAKSNYVNSIFKNNFKPTLDVVWDGGENKNKNAALTIFRHFDTASVEFGFIGKNPQSMWLIEYPLLEKIHYLLVAGFDVYGNYGHQLKTRVYMDFLRMEGESNFIGLLPKASRKSTIEQWYKDEPDTTTKYFNNSLVTLKSDTGISYKSENHYAELRENLSAHLSKSLTNTHELTNSALPPEHIKHLQELSEISGTPVSFLPQVTFITVEEGNKDHFFTLIHNNAHTNVSHLFSENDRRVPTKDTLTLANGFIGAYPNVYIKLTTNELALFTQTVSNLSSSNDYAKLLNNFGIRRTHNGFWAHSDKVHEAMKSSLPIEHGLLDYNRLGNQ